MKNNRLSNTYMLKNKSLVLFLFSFVIGVFSISGQISQQSLTNRLSSDEQRKLDYYFYSAINAKAIGNFPECYDYLKYCAQIDSTNANVLFELGNFYASLEKDDIAYDYYAKAIKYDPDNFYYNIAFAGATADKEDYATTAKIYDKLIKENPNKVELYMYLSEAYRLDGKYDKAIDALDNLERTMGMDEKISMQKFKLYSLQNNTKKAYAEVQKYIDKNPDETRYYVLLGNLYLQDNKTQEAYMALTKAKAIDPDDPLLITSLANYYEIVNNKEAAQEELKVALFSPRVEVDTKLGVLAQYVNILQQNKQDPGQANALFDTLMVEYPQEAKFNLLYGNLLLLQNKKKEANYQFKIYTESDPTNIVGWEQLLQSTDFDSIQSIIDVCKSAITYLPEQPVFYFYLSAGQFQNKEYREALNTLNEGIGFVPASNATLLSEFYGQMGSLYHELGHQDSTFLSYDKALTYNPENFGVLNNYSYYLSLVGKDLDKAEKMSSITIKAEPTNPTYLDTYGWILFEKEAYSIAKIYLEKAVNYSQEKDKEVSAEVLEHYGDVLFKTDEREKALEYWIKAKEKGSESKTLDLKIELKTYVEQKK